MTQTSSNIPVQSAPGGWGVDRNKKCKEPVAQRLFPHCLYLVDDDWNVLLRDLLVDQNVAVVEGNLLYVRPPSVTLLRQEIAFKFGVL